MGTFCTGLKRLLCPAFSWGFQENTTSAREVDKRFFRKAKEVMQLNSGATQCTAQRGALNDNETSEQDRRRMDKSLSEQRL
jgi:hypothetical protein